MKLHTTRSTGKLNVRKSLGQGMTEYIIIVALIAIAAIGVFGAFGDVVQNQVAGMASELGGGDGTAAMTEATTRGAAAATSSVAADNSLANYATDNNVN